MSRLVVASAEASGERLARALLAALPGVEALHLRAPAHLGIAEVVASIPAVLARLDAMEAEVAAFRPDVVVTVDSPDLMLRLARRARRRGVPVVHWVSPQIWAWRRGRVRQIAGSVDTMMCLLPFEPPLYQGHVRAVFTGHPAAAIRPASDAPRPGSPTFALCPGSRPSEAAALWPALREVARQLRRRFPKAGFVVPRAPTIERLTGLDAVHVDDLARCADADAAVVASGTATLELAALGVPMVAVYRVHPLTWAIGRHLVDLEHVALPNLRAGREVVPEVLQDLDPERIAEEVGALVGARDQVPPEVIASLDGERAIARAASEVAAWL